MEIQISDLLMSAKKYFTHYEINEILEDGLKAILNLVPKDFIGLITRNDNLSEVDHLYMETLPLAILEGDTMFYRIILKPQLALQVIQQCTKENPKNNLIIK